MKIKPGTKIVCSECRSDVGECKLAPVHGVNVSELIDLCFTGFTAGDGPFCKSCKGSFYKPRLGFFTKDHGWTW